MSNKKIRQIEFLEYQASAYGDIKSVGTKIRITNNYLDKYFEAREPLFKIHDDDLDKFVEKLNAIKVLDWKDEYHNDSILDGDSWKLVIVYNYDKKKLISGINDYPSTLDKLNTPEDTVTNSEKNIERTLYDEFEDALAAIVDSCGGGFDADIEDEPYDLLPVF